MRRAAVIFAIALGATPARADSLAAAREHFAGLDFELVLGDADAVIHDANAPRAAVVEAWFLRGSALVVLDRDADATAAFEALLVLAPDHRAPANTPPRILAAFQGARAAHAVRLEEELATVHGAELKNVKLDVSSPATPRGGRAATWTIHLTDATHLVDRVVLGYRREIDREYSVVEATPGAELELTIPGGITSSERDYRIAWYVDALHAGARVRSTGSVDAPNWLAIGAGKPPRPPAITQRWWFWTGVAALAASAVAVPLLVDRARDVGAQPIRFIPPP
jgi:hypothetical protein